MLASEAKALDDWRLKCRVVDCECRSSVTLLPLGAILIPFAHQ